MDGNDQFCVFGGLEVSCIVLAVGDKVVGLIESFCMV